MKDEIELNKMLLSVLVGAQMFKQEGLKKDTKNELKKGGKVAHP